MLTLLSKYPELLALTLNVSMTMVFGYRAMTGTGDWGKAMYWLGASILTGGLLKMKG